MKTALFVDFDNVFSGLRHLDPAYAEQFATRPGVWMQWLTDQLPLPPYVEGTARRRILVRRCYLNPAVYQRFRFAFSQAGFEIVDCPPMTQAGKTSTDIHMVLDMVDVLQHSTHYDEFIVFSADADFSPVLRKLRRSDRRTTVLAAGATSSAYQASADLMIDPDDFIGQALGFDKQQSWSEEQMHNAVRIVHQAVEFAKAPVELLKLAELLTAQLPHPNASGWADADDFRNFLGQLELTPLLIDDVYATVRDPRHGANATGSAVIKTVKKHTQTAHSVVLEELAQSSRPVPCAMLAQVVKSRATDLEPNWNGYGTFRKYLESLDLGKLQVQWHTSGGFVFDPARHAMPEVPNKAAPDESWQARDALWLQVSPVFSMSNLPVLSPRKYGVTLVCLSQALESTEFNLLETGKQVHELILARDESVSRRDINQLLRAMLFGGFDPASGATDVMSLAYTVCEIGLAACAREGLGVDESLRTAVASWIGDGVANAS